MGKNPQTNKKNLKKSKKKNPEKKGKELVKGNTLACQSLLSDESSVHMKGENTQLGKGGHHIIVVLLQCSRGVNQYCTRVVELGELFPFLPKVAHPEVQYSEAVGK